MEEFDILMSVTTDLEKQQEHRQTLFLVLTLAGLPPDNDSVRDQILDSPTVPTIDELFSRLLRLAAPPSHKVVSSPTVDSSILASQTFEKCTYQSTENRRGGGRFGNLDPSVVIVISLDTLVTYVIFSMVHHPVMILLF